MLGALFCQRSSRARLVPSPRARPPPGAADRLPKRLSGRRKASPSRLALKGIPVAASASAKVPVDSTRLDPTRLLSTNHALRPAQALRCAARLPRAGFAARLQFRGERGRPRRYRAVRRGAPGRPPPPRARLCQGPLDRVPQRRLQHRLHAELQRPGGVPRPPGEPARPARYGTLNNTCSAVPQGDPEHVQSDLSSPLLPRSRDPSLPGRARLVPVRLDQRWQALSACPAASWQEKGASATWETPSPCLGGFQEMPWLPLPALN